MSAQRRKVKRKLKKKVKRLLIVFLMLVFLVIGCIAIFKNVEVKEVKKVLDKITTTKKLPDINIEDEHIYMINGEEYSVFIEDERVKYTSSNEEVATVDNGIIKPVANGETTITVSHDKGKDEVLVTVTDLIGKPVIANDKSFLSCKKYSKEENELLDNFLEFRINKAGYQTRAGAVAAARFLALEFKYRIYYFYENGRLLTNGERSYVDGEGRYYHKGLYLSEGKFSDIKASQYGPAIWSCNLYSKIVKLTTPNGLDCSGYVSWLLLNAGFDVGDAGAGINLKKENDLDDLGEKLNITKENLDSGKIKVGDLVSTYGHIGILIGMENDTYYIAESLERDLHVLTMTKAELLKSDWLSFILMDEVYKEDGNLTNMW